MTNLEAARMARRLPFDFTGRTLENFPGIRLGLERIVAKQLRRRARAITSAQREVRRSYLQHLMGAA